MTALINSFVLTLINISAILIGFFVFYISKSSNQIAIQVVTACLSTFLLFLIWQFLCRHLFKKISLKTNSDYTKVFFLSLIWTPFVFVPLHYLAEGYLTSWQNITGIWLFQIPTNILILKIHNNFSAIFELKDKLKKVSE